MSKPKKPKKRRINFFLSFIIKISIIAVIVYLIITYVLTIRRLEGNNMFPSIKDGDLCVFYKLEDSHLSDVVLYKDQKGKERVGRIVAVAGQEVNFPEAGGYTVNDYQPTEEITYQTFVAERSKVEYPLVVDEDSYFIMNDFRSDTKDSREIGVIKKDQIQGKIIFILRRRGF